MAPPFPSPRRIILPATAHRPWPLPTGPWVGRQTWLDLLFAHWPVPAERLRPFVPPALTVQEHEGTSWVGLVPFRMDNVSARGLPNLPGLSAFPEMNLRLYVELDGRPGVWFISLDADKRPAVWGARLSLNLPYFAAAMSVTNKGDRVHYASVRRGQGARVAFRARYWPTSAEQRHAQAGTLDHFLTERYCLYNQRRDGRIQRLDIHHLPWPLQPAAAEIDENTVAAAQGITATEGAPLLHFARKLDVLAWPPKTVRPAGTARAALSS
ncbi:MAG TPA: DUF2071 domain-containing protein [Polyangia bacterium]